MSLGIVLELMLYPIVVDKQIVRVRKHVIGEKSIRKILVFGIESLTPYSYLLRYASSSCDENIVGVNGFP